MPRFQLLIREPGKPPRVVALTAPLVVGRSRRADVPVDDEEVGREQFRIGPDGDGVFLEGIGKTNRTVVNGSAVASGQRLAVTGGAVIQVGRTSFELQALDHIAPAPTPTPVSEVPDATMVAPRPPGPPAQLPPEESTGGYTGPLHTMELRRPGEPPPPKTPPTESLAEPGGMTMAPRAGYRPGQAAGNQPPATEDPGRTMPLPPTARRPGATPPPTPTKPPTAAGDVGLTMPPSAGYRPGAGRNEPAAPPPPAPSVPAPAAAPATPPAPPSAPPPAPVTNGPSRGKTVVVGAGDLPTPAGATPAADLEARMHQTLPRVFVKAQGIKRRLRLMKVHNRIGRAETSDVLLPHDSVSELHAELRFDGQRWHLRDAGSTNGSLLDGELLRGSERPIGRHTQLGFGNLRAIFLCNDPASAAADRRLEERAVRCLVRNGRLSRDVADEAVRMARSDQTQSLAELLLMDTPVEPADWSAAIGEARARPGLLARLLGLFRGRTKQPPPPLQ
jgi:pSer/pThr/pTyr-binding forkhead associated (FHA) protein